MRVDVAVVGAGLAGLTAARALMDSGLDVVVLEARDRVGGRTLSRQVHGSVVDVGAQWISPRQRRMGALVRELGLATFPTHRDGARVLDVAGETITYEGTIPRLSPLHLVQLELARRSLARLAGDVDAERPWLSRGAVRHDRRTLADWLRAHVPPVTARRVVASAMRVVFGADPAELPLLHVLAYVRAAGTLDGLLEVEGGAQDTRIAGGTAQIAHHLAEDLAVETDTPILRIDWNGDVTLASDDDRTWSARHAIVAVPPGLVARIRFDPPLPARRREVNRRWIMGSTTKVVAVYREPFWRRRGFSGEIVATRGPVSVAFDDGDATGALSALLGFVVGDHARVWSSRPERDRHAAVLETFARAFGEEARSPVAVVEHDWSQETWTGGCPTANPLPTALTTVGQALTAPIGPLHWAGTETATEWRGFMEGAVESGERAAREVLATLA